MAEKSRFFDNTESDPRSYPSSDMAELLSAIISTGVVKGLGQELAVTPAGTGLTVTVGTGIAFVKGRWYANTEAKTIQLDAIDGDRVDHIILRLDNDTGPTSRKIVVEKKTGNVTQTDTNYEIILASVQLRTGQTLVTASDITDKRGVSGAENCPYASVPAVSDLLLTAAQKAALTGGNSTTLHKHDAYSLTSHNHDQSYSSTSHNHSGLYATITQLNAKQDAIQHGTTLPSAGQAGRVFVLHK